MFEPLFTERLIVRAPEIGDAEALHRRRNHPEVARFQSWAVPYSMDDARKLAAGAAAMDGPADGEWWMATIVERSSPEAGEAGEPIGDLAIYLDRGGLAAELGYSIKPEYWGRGIATEAAAALVDHLTEGGVRRWWASTHPDNTASVRVLERLGFRYEGRTVAGFFERDPGAPSDGLWFGMTADDRRAWLERPTGPPSDVRLVAIDHTNQRRVAELTTHHWQRNFVATVAQSYADALFPEPYEGRPVQPWMRAIEITEADGQVTLAGYVMLAWPLVPEDEPYLWRLLIDRRHQGRSIASQALDQIEDLLRADGHPCIATSWVPGPGSPQPFYLARGYELTGEEEDGELVGRKALT